MLYPTEYLKRPTGPDIESNIRPDVGYEKRLNIRQGRILNVKSGRIFLTRNIRGSLTLMFDHKYPTRPDSNSDRILEKTYYPVHP